MAVPKLVNPATKAIKPPVLPRSIGFDGDSSVANSPIPIVATNRVNTAETSPVVPAVINCFFLIEAFM